MFADGERLPLDEDRHRSAFRRPQPLRQLDDDGPACGRLPSVSHGQFGKNEPSVIRGESAGLDALDDVLRLQGADAGLHDTGVYVVGGAHFVAPAAVSTSICLRQSAAASAVMSVRRPTFITRGPFPDFQRAYRCVRLTL